MEVDSEDDKELVQGISCLAVSRKGDIIGVGTIPDNVLQLWNTDTGKFINSLIGHTDKLSCIAFTSSSKYVVSGSSDQTLRLWDIQSGSCLQTFTGHTNVVTTLSFLSRSNIIISGSDDKTIKLWGIANGACLQTLEDHTHFVTGLKYLPDKKILISCDFDGVVKQWENDGVDPSVLLSLKSSFHSGLTIIDSMAFSADGTQFCLASHNGQVDIYDTASCTKIKSINLWQEPGDANRVVFSPNGKYICACNNRQNIIWNLEDDTMIEFATDSNFGRAIFSPDLNSEFIFFGSYYGTTNPKVYDLTGNFRYEFKSLILPENLFPGYVLTSQLVGSAGHASPTEIWTGHKIDNPGKMLTFKIFLDYDGVPTKITKDGSEYLDMIDRLHYESEMYRAISDIDVLKRNAVQFVDFVKSAKYVYRTTDRNIDKLIDRINVVGQLRDRLVPRAIVTHLESNVTTLSEWTKEKRSEDEWKAVFFQLLWGIQTLNRYGFQHNDMHSGNILISPNWPDNNRVYEAFAGSGENINIFDIPLNSPRIIFFDWDFGTRKRSINPIAQKDNWLCRKYGGCETINEKPELFLAFYKLWSVEDIPQKAREFQMSSAAPDGSEFYKDNGELRRFPCNKIHGLCTPYPPGLPNRIKSTSKLLADKYFKDYRRMATAARRIANHML